MRTVEKSLRLHLRVNIIVIIIGLAVSGITAFPIETELSYLVNHTNNLPIALQTWIKTVYTAVKDTNHNYPYLSYGTDWLAFAHIMLAILFIGPLKNPIKNKWVIQFGMICCISIIPLAFIAGSIRQIPFFWQLIDCSFGIIAIIPLGLCLLDIKKLETLNEYEIYV
ncbi:hypothetical protein EZ428_13685 [Pedobacter frigiditerrae]|uniref:Uncharacterized protein n=1 Tax=Pedobacter frigiditerrae TaxID=2530452 RepID=A0A4R0MU32_9SPHI|nr:hypothetical protein [Pedobacter frigiditerrae]TCC90323.1 hypothetical protein EZ428_13685 [Pedobacter frigiditerrae]